MNYAAIVAEINPLHQGHIRLIRRAQKDGYGVVVLMSGSFTQRGLPVVVDKFTRARDLIDIGVDLVITLPVQIATSYGERFSEGAMTFLERIGGIDRVYCGTEWGSLSLFSAIYHYEKSAAFQDDLRRALDAGDSYSSAYLFALKEKDPSWQNLFQSNALLAYGYYKALVELCGPELELVKRTRGKDAIESAGAIRALYETDPAAAQQFSAKTPPQFKESALLKRLYPLYRYRFFNKIDLSPYDGFEKGIDHRLNRYLRDCKDMETFLDAAKTRRYSRWRLTRILLHALLGIDGEEILASLRSQTTFQVLASSQVGHHFLAQAKKGPAKLLTNYKHVKKSAQNDRTRLRFEEQATDLWNILTEGPMGRDFYGK